ncbi:MAG: penicillin acylase family protein [Bacteroidota bacterium]
MPKYFLFLLLLNAQFLLAQIDPANITIVRDTFGTPHVFAPTDAEVAYGFAWVSAEDDFKTMQAQLLPIKGLNGLVNGKQGAIFDVAVHLLDPHTVVETSYETEVPADFKKVLNGYVEGVNAYAASHPKEVLHKKLFPIGPKDILKAYVVGLALLSGADRDLVMVLNERVEKTESMRERGSNAFAISSQKTTDGKTYLAINSHQPLEGLNSWYEAHLVSEEGWNILGASFIGGLSIFGGVNEYLGWAHTVNYPDLTDVYRLEMHPEEEEMYRLDGQWLKLEPYNVKARIKLLGLLPIGAKQKFFRSRFGVTIKTSEGVFAFKTSAATTLKAAEQWYRMNKATNLTEFQAALDLQGIVSTNIVYADGEDNIFYISNGHFPKRNPAYDWEGILPGDTSATFWGDFYPTDSCAQVLNPPSGYVFNCNHTPFLSSGPGDDPDPAKVPATMGYQRPGDLTNRAVRFDELIQSYEKVSWEDFLAIKYDQAYSKPLKAYPKLEAIFHLDPNQYPEVASSLNLIQKWDRVTNVESEAATIFVLSFIRIWSVLGSSRAFQEGDDLSPTIMVEAIQWTEEYLMKHFGKKTVPWGDVQQLSRGEKSLPFGGSFDVLAAVSSRRQKDGSLKPVAGESYISLVRFGPEGPEIETINPYGASARPESPHYTDQMELFTQQKRRKMTLDKEKVMKEAVRTYHPE